MFQINNFLYPLIARLSCQRKLASSFIFAFISFLFLLAYSPFTYSLQKDNKEKIFITADSSIYNYKVGTNLFEGHVNAKQGTTHITGDKIITKSNNKHEIQEVIAYGDKELAHYWTIPKLGDKEIHAQAKIIKFFPLTSNVTLEQNVIITQGENNFHGELILYNMQEETITVPASAKGRAVLVYNPEK